MVLEEDLTRRAQQLRQDLDLEALLITRSEQGMTIYTAEGELMLWHKLKRCLMSGAGDTVLAVLRLHEQQA